MKRTYQELEMEIILLDACDILTASGGLTDGGKAGTSGIVIEDLNTLISGN